MGRFIQDIQYALRQLRKTPGFTITAVLTLALGIGANAAIFTLVNAVLLKELPVKDPKMLVHVGDGESQCCVGSGLHDSGNYGFFSTDTYQQFKKNNSEFEELAAMEAGYEYRPLTMRRDGAQGQASSVMAEFVSGNYFRMFGLQPAAGRLMTDSDDVEGAPLTAVMSYETWKDDYNSDPSVLGSTFWVNTKPATVVGIAPEGFYGDRLMSRPPQYFLPMNLQAGVINTNYQHDPQTSWLWIIGRVKPGVSREALQVKMNTQLKQILTADYAKDISNERDKTLLAKTHVGLADGGASGKLGYGDQLKLLMWISALVLLIACANIANLLLVRGMGRKSEMAVRTALGAARARIVRQLLTESVLLATISGVVALVVSYTGSRLLLMLAFPGDQHVPISSAPSLEVLGFAVGVSALTGVLFGVAPALIAAQAQPADALRGGSRTTAGGASLLQRGLVVGQAGLSLVLLVGAGLFAQNLSKLEHSDMKLDATNRYIIHFNPQAAGYGTMQVDALYRTIENQFHAIPGVVKVGMSTYTPMEDDNWGNGVQIQGQSDLHKGASFLKATAEYFDSVGTRVVMGRGIGVQDTMTSPPVAVVNQAFVKTFFKPGENPIGHRFGSPGPKSDGDYEIVGVVEDTAYQSVQWKDHEMFFIPMMQRGASNTSPVDKDMSFYAGAIVVETSRPMTDMESIARRTLSSINPNLAVVKFQTFTAQIAGQFTRERMLSRLMMLFGGLALLLATVGLYGVTAYTVARRTSEIGIRMALGAERSGVVAMILRSAMAQTLVGLAIGVPVAYYCIRFVKSQLYDMNNVSASAMAIAVVTLLVAAFVAGLIPGRRAASIDPAKALRSE